MAELNVEDTLEKLCQEVHLLDMATAFIKCKSTMKSELQEMHSEVLALADSVTAVRKSLETMREQNVKCRELLSLIENLNKKIIYMEQNVPPNLIRDYKSTEVQSVTENDTSKHESIINIQDEQHAKSENICISSKTNGQEVKDCKKMLFSEPEVCPTISLITEEEYNKVPKYIIGRQSLETVNSLVKTINQILKAKYTILMLGKAAAQKRREINLYLHYRKQELEVTEDNGYVYFFTGEDYYRHTKSKLDKIKLNLIVVLRHCKRLREYRSKNELRYIVTSHF